MPLRTGTICSKHDKIKDSANHIRVLCEGIQVPSCVGNCDACSIDSLAFLIVDLAEKCFEDGQRMEIGLDTKEGRIAELEEQVKQLKSILEDLDWRPDE